MPDLQLPDHFFQGNGPSGKRELQDAYDIKTAQYRVGVFIPHSLFNHKQHRHHHHCHVMVTTPPLSGLILTHAALVLGILEVPFNPVSLGLHIR